MIFSFQTFCTHARNQLLPHNTSTSIAFKFWFVIHTKLVCATLVFGKLGFCCCCCCRVGGHCATMQCNPSFHLFNTFFCDTFNRIFYRPSLQHLCSIELKLQHRLWFFFSSVELDKYVHTFFVHWRCLNVWMQSVACQLLMDDAVSQWSMQSQKKTAADSSI